MDQNILLKSTHKVPLLLEEQQKSGHKKMMGLFIVQSTVQKPMPILLIQMNPLQVQQNHGQHKILQQSLVHYLVLKNTLVVVMLLVVQQKTGLLKQDRHKLLLQIIRQKHGQMMTVITLEVLKIGLVKQDLHK